MEHIISVKETMPQMKGLGFHTYFYSLIDRLKVHSEWKYPDRMWSNETYYNIAWEWREKRKELEERVIKLEQEMNETIKNNKNGQKRS